MTSRTTPHAIVTGAARGIGAATAELLAARGYAVTLADLLDASATLESITTAGGVASAAELDVRDRDAVRRVVEASAEAHGGVDLLVSSAGVYGSTRRIDEIEPDELDLVIGVNLYGTFWAVQAALPFLRESRGRIICIGSLAGRIGGLRAGPHYAASKGGIHALVRWLAQAEAASGVLVNGIAPGVVETPMIDGKGYVADTLPLGRFAEASEIASVVLFLASPGASYMTGTVVDVNGGVHAS